MIRNQQVQERWRKQRLDGKSIDTMFQNRLIEEARCSPIVARAIWGMVNETLIGTDVVDESGAEAARVGQLIFLAVAADDLPGYGKRIEDTQLVPVILDLVTCEDIDLLLDGREWNDQREARITRLCEQAHAPGGLLSQVDIGLMRGGYPATRRSPKQFRAIEIATLWSAAGHGDVDPSLARFDVAHLWFRPEGAATSRIVRGVGFPPLSPEWTADRNFACDRSPTRFAAVVPSRLGRSFPPQ